MIHWNRWHHFGWTALQLFIIHIVDYSNFICCWYADTHVDSHNIFAFRCYFFYTKKWAKWMFWRRRDIFFFVSKLRRTVNISFISELIMRTCVPCCWFGFIVWFVIRPNTHTQLFAQNNKSSQLTVMDNIVWVLTGAERKKKTEKRKHKNLLDFTNLIVNVCCCRTSSNH